MQLFSTTKAFELGANIHRTFLNLKRYCGKFATFLHDYVLHTANYLTPYVIKNYLSGENITKSLGEFSAFLR